MPGKFLELIGRKTILEHCIDRAIEAGIQPWVATDSVDIIYSIGGKCTCILTGEANCGTARVAMAADLIDPEGNHQHIINYQGDMPFIDPVQLRSFITFTENSDAEVCTAWCKLKVVTMDDDIGFRRMEVKSHIGLYGYERYALERFASMPQSEMEIAASLEQLRAPEKFTWDSFEFPAMPIEINKKIDLEEVRRCLV